MEHSVISSSSLPAIIAVYRAAGTGRSKYNNVSKVTLGIPSKTKAELKPPLPATVLKITVD